MADDEKEEDKAIKAIDRQRIRAKLGNAVCTLLDMAASGASTTEIADTLSVSRAKAEKYVDQVIEKYLNVAA
jgi:response regulator of citrate/malate metabolism